MKSNPIILTILGCWLVFHVTFAQPFFHWATNPVGTGDDRGFRIATDLSGNVFVTGRHHSKNLLFDKINLTNADPVNGTGEIFLAKYDPNGKVIWAKDIQGTGDDFGSDCTTDRNGNAILIGLYDSESISVGGKTFKNRTARDQGSDIAVVKYSPDGRVLWAHSIGGEKHDSGYASCATDKKGNVYVTGQFYSARLFLDSMELVNSKARGADVFLAKYSPTGKLMWARSSRGPDTFDSESQSCSVDAKGDVIISGWFSGPHIVFGADTLRRNEAGNNGIFVAKYHSSGKLAWAKNYPGVIATTRLDPKGNIFLAGAYADSVLTLGKQVYRNNGEADLLVVKLNPDGNLLWARGDGGSAFEGIRNFCVDAKGNVIVTGTFTSPAWKMGSTVLNKDSVSVTLKPEQRTEDMFIGAYSNNGDFLWAYATGGLGRNAGRGCATDPQGNVYWTGSFDVNKLRMGPLILTNSGDSDLFLVKLSGKR